MDTALIVIIVIAILIVAAIAAFLYLQSKRSTDLRERFGPEYDRTVSNSGRLKGEQELSERQKRVEKLNIVPLSNEARRGYAESWRNVQAHFVDEPGKAIGEADDLVQRVMAERGYPIGDFEQRVADISVDHADVVDNYRKAHSISRAQAGGGVSTEQLRQAMVHYKALFEDLLAETPEPSMTQRR